MPSAVHIHLIFNHLPIFSLTAALLLIIYGLFRCNYYVTNTSLVFLIFAGVFTLIAFKSGEAAESIIENLAIQESFIEHHEEAAQYALWGGLTGGFWGIFNLISHLYYKKIQYTFSLISLCTVLITVGLLIWTAYLGGKIRHTEIRNKQNVSTQITP